MEKEKTIERIKSLMSDEYINSIACEESRSLMMWKRDQAQKVIDHTPLEEMKPQSLHILYNALDHCESR